MPRMVNCAKLGRELPGLERPPFPGPLGERIYNEISQEAYNLWPAQSTLIINHYGLSLGDPNAQKILLQQMEEFFFGADAKMPEGWTPPVRQAKDGAPRRK
jgi:Fe-S cluster biosynthesis and repair protein YggX